MARHNEAVELKCWSLFVQWSELPKYIFPENNAYIWMPIDFPELQYNGCCGFIRIPTVFTYRMDGKFDTWLWRKGGVLFLFFGGGGVAVVESW